jgi:hypothetical protein
VSHIVDSQFDKILRRFYGQRPEPHCIQQLKDRGVRADTKGK